jgi:prepilin-type N-terminal cleavage/methylation domain-containing protein
MKIMFKRSSRGFTLIELLVVIAIIGILSSVVLASLNDARQKSRDAKRVADIKQLQLALELYFDSNGTYPSSTSQLAPNFISVVPTDPVNNSAYFYAGLGSGATCTDYHLGATIEQSGHSSLGADSDVNTESASKCDDGGTGFDGAAAQVYDVQP